MFLIGANVFGQSYTKAQIVNINNLKQAYEGDIYIDVLNKDYYIGASDSTLSKINNKIDSTVFINDSSLVFYWNFKETDTIDFNPIIDSSEWKFDDENGVYLRRAIIENTATDDSVFFVKHGRLIIADTVKNTLTYQDPNASTQIFLANFNPTRNVARQMSIQNDNTAGNRAYALYTTATDSSKLFVGSHGSSRTLNRMGLPVKNSNELVAIEGDLHIGTREANSIYFGTDNLSRGIWDKDGNVGIGTVEPYVPWINGSGGLTKLPAKLGVKTETGRQDISFFSSAATSNPVNVALSAPLSTGDTGTLFLSYRGNHVTPLYTDWVDFVSNDGNGIVRERLLRFNMLNGDVVFDESKVGIHTNSPTDTLDINGTLRIRELPKAAKTDSVLTVNNGQVHKMNIDTLARNISPIKAYGKISATATVLKGYNIGTVTNPTTGNYVVTFAMPMTDGNYIIQLSQPSRSGAGNDDPAIAYFGQTLNGFSVEIGDNDNGGTDRGLFNSEFMFTIITFD